MRKKLCLIHANCQGDPLADLLRLHPDVGRRFEIVKYTNFEREHIPGEQLERCAVFIYQHLGPQWEESASDSLLARISSGAQRIVLPNMLFKGYWPFWESGGRIDFSDSYLNQLIDRGLAAPEIAYLYLRTDITRLHDLDGILADTLAREREKEARGEIPYVALIERGFRKRHLFNSINHPGRELLFHVACSVVLLLGFTPFSPADYESFRDPYPEFFQPIHPQVARHFGIPFADEATRWPAFGLNLTFEQYVLAYIDCRQRGISDFVGYLQGAYS